MYERNYLVHVHVHVLIHVKVHVFPKGFGTLFTCWYIWNIHIHVVHVYVLIHVKVHVHVCPKGFDTLFRYWYIWYIHIHVCTCTYVHVNLSTKFNICSLQHFTIFLYSSSMYHIAIVLLNIL